MLPLFWFPGPRLFRGRLLVPSQLEAMSKPVSPAGGKDRTGWGLRRHPTHPGLIPHELSALLIPVFRVGSSTIGLPPEGHAARTRRATVTKTPIKRNRLQMIDQFSISILADLSQSVTESLKMCPFPTEWSLLLRASLHRWYNCQFFLCMSKISTVRTQLAGPRHTKD